MKNLITISKLNKNEIIETINSLFELFRISEISGKSSSHHRVIESENLFDYQYRTSPSREQKEKSSSNLYLDHNNFQGIHFNGYSRLFHFKEGDMINIQRNFIQVIKTDRTSVLIKY